ncbi:MAG: hypothetical protein NTV23_06180 [Propionibacteriales bacterium]|nr:hypothetical protein [Propionibacteriales bacterium]
MSERSVSLDQISRVNALLAAKQGGQACRDGQSLADCPYGSATQTERFLALYWRDGFAAAKR